jgi:hypothetical protein
MLSRGTGALSFDCDSADAPTVVVGLSSGTSAALGGEVVTGLVAGVVAGVVTGAASTGAGCCAGAASSWLGSTACPGSPGRVGLSGSAFGDAEAARGLASWPFDS